jgi:hypothetical protein
MQVRSPGRSLGLPAPRPKVRRYKYISDEEPDLPTIVFDIINSLPIEEVDPELYQRLLPLLRDRERALKEWRNQPASRAIEIAIAYIVSYRYENDPNKLKPRALRTMRKTSNKLSPTELAITINLAMRGEFDDIDPRHYNVIIKELQKLKTDALSEGDYLLAERVMNASRRVIALTSDNRFRDIATAKVDDLEMQLQVKSTDRDDLIERTAKSIEAAEHRRDADLRRMERENDRELREFDKQFDMEPPPELRKFSPQLLQLRMRERYMVQSGRFREATAAREEAERMEKEESEEHRRRWAAQLKLQRADLSNRQQEKMYVRRANADHLIAKMRRAGDDAIDHQEKAVQHIESQYQGARVVQNFSAAAGSAGAGKKAEALPRLKTHTIEPEAVQFRQRALINTIVYSRTSPHSARA